MTFNCETCGFSLWNPIAELKSSVLGLYDDARFPGRCLLSARGHFTDLSEMSADDSCSLLSEAVHVGEAIKRVTGASRINYAVLGNAEPHVHFHIIPRFPHVEPKPRKSPWDDPRPQKTNSSEERKRLIELIKKEIEN